ncbi:hypothetical protein JCM30237_20750 [Halolamina litorea]|uniref:DUF7322 domain-containing protein n=1 Tax=Halolamina litorea TaxID=1515593 RepID=A0ABD6BNL2_9EURY|nr:hypothetical protein [Halolamina litorea]
MSDDDPVDAFVEGTVEPFGDEDDEPLGPSAPKARDMEAELRERTGADPDSTEDLSEIDGDTATAFWAAVFYVNVGVLLLAVGPILYVDRGNALVSLAVFAAGAALVGRAYMVYRNFRAERDAESADEEDPDGERDAEQKDTVDEAAEEDATDDGATDTDDL